MVNCQVSIIMTGQALNFEAFFRVSRCVFLVVFSSFQRRRLIFPLALYKSFFASFIRSLSSCKNFPCSSLSFPLSLSQHFFPYFPPSLTDNASRHKL